MFPEMEYYELWQLSRRWKLELSQVRHYVETGRLAAVCWLDKCAVEYGQWKKTAHGFECFEPLSMDWFRGFVGVRTDDVRKLFRQGNIICSSFYSLHERSYVLKLVEESDFSLSTHDIRILKSEVIHFEDQNNNDISLPVHSTPVEVSVDGRTVTMHGKSYRLGVIQGRVLSQLKQVADSDNPWIHGKTLLHQAGSQSFQLKNIFRHQKHWRDWIESDGRGYYRLKT